MYSMKNKRFDEQTATPEKYPQGYFKIKNCKNCDKHFKPKAPSHLYCSQECADEGIVTSYLKRTYDISFSDYKAMLLNQNNLCCICKTEGFIMDSSKHKLKLVVDHCHKTGKVRGLLCHNCNRALGLFKDSTVSLSNAIEYLKV